MSQWQLRFDGGHQQRYMPDRRSVLRYVLDVGPRSLDARFEVWREGAPLRLADGSDGGRHFELVEVLDLREPGVRDRIVAELEHPSEAGGEA